MPYQRLKKLLLRIPEPRAQALLMTIYASYGRVGEIVKGRLGEGQLNPNSRPLVRDDFEIYHRQNKKYLRIRVSTLKQKKRVSRHVFIGGREAWMAKRIWAFVEPIESRQVIFKNRLGTPLSSRSAELLFKKHISAPMGLDSENVHLFRSWRATHASRGDFTKDRRPYPIEAQMQEAGWKTPSTPLVYYNKVKAEDYLDLR